MCTGFYTSSPSHVLQSSIPILDAHMVEQFSTFDITLTHMYWNFGMCKTPQCCHFSCSYVLFFSALQKGRVASLHSLNTVANGLACMDVPSVHVLHSNTAKGWIVHTIIFPQKRFIQREFIWEALTWMISAAKPMTYICGENPVDRILIHDLLLIGSTWCKLGYHFKLSHNNSTSY